MKPNISILLILLALSSVVFTAYNSAFSSVELQTLARNGNAPTNGIKWISYVRYIYCIDPDTSSEDYVKIPAPPIAQQSGGDAREDRTVENDANVDGANYKRDDELKKAVENTDDQFHIRSKTQTSLNIDQYGGNGIKYGGGIRCEDDTKPEFQIQTEKHKRFISILIQSVCKGQPDPNQFCLPFTKYIVDYYQTYDPNTQKWTTDTQREGWEPWVKVCKDCSHTNLTIDGCEANQRYNCDNRQWHKLPHNVCKLPEVEKPQSKCQKAYVRGETMVKEWAGVMFENEVNHNSRANQVSEDEKFDNHSFVDKTEREGKVGESNNFNKKMSENARAQPFDKRNRGPVNDVVNCECTCSASMKTYGLHIPLGFFRDTDSDNNEIKDQECAKLKGNCRNGIMSTVSSPATHRKSDTLSVECQKEVQSNYIATQKGQCDPTKDGNCKGDHNLVDKLKNCFRSELKKGGFTIQKVCEYHAISKGFQSISELMKEYNDMLKQPYCIEYEPGMPHTMENCKYKQDSSPVKIVCPFEELPYKKAGDCMMIDTSATPNAHSREIIRAEDIERVNKMTFQVANQANLDNSDGYNYSQQFTINPLKDPFNSYMKLVAGDWVLDYEFQKYSSVIDKVLDQSWMCENRVKYVREMTSHGIARKDSELVDAPCSCACPAYGSDDAEVIYFRPEGWSEFFTKFENQNEKQTALCKQSCDGGIATEIIVQEKKKTSNASVLCNPKKKNLLAAKSNPKVNCISFDTTSVLTPANILLKCQTGQAHEYCSSYDESGQCNCAMMGNEGMPYQNGYSPYVCPVNPEMIMTINDSPNCILFHNVEQNCLQCKENYVLDLKDNTCKSMKNSEIEDCMYYKENTNDGTLPYCTVCKNGKQPSDSGCGDPTESFDGCDIYNGVGCVQCEDGKILNNEENEQCVNVEEGDSPKNCLRYSKENNTKCLECKIGYMQADITGNNKNCVLAKDFHLWCMQPYIGAVLKEYLQILQKNTDPTIEERLDQKAEIKRKNFKTNEQYVAWNQYKWFKEVWANFFENKAMTMPRPERCRKAADLLATDVYGSGLACGVDANDRSRYCNYEALGHCEYVGNTTEGKCVAPSPNLISEGVDSSDMDVVTWVEGCEPVPMHYEEKRD